MSGRTMISDNKENRLFFAHVRRLSQFCQTLAFKHFHCRQA